MGEMSGGCAGGWGEAKDVVGDYGEGEFDIDYNDSEEEY